MHGRVLRRRLAPFLLEDDDGGFSERRHMGNLWATWGYTWTHACRGPLAANVLAEIHDLRTTWKVHHDACYPERVELPIAKRQQTWKCVGHITTGRSAAPPIQLVSAKSCSARVSVWPPTVFPPLLLDWP